MGHAAHFSLRLLIVRGQVWVLRRKARISALPLRRLHTSAGGAEPKDPHRSPRDARCAPSATDDRMPSHARVRATRLRGSGARRRLPVRRRDAGHGQLRSARLGHALPAQPAARRRGPQGTERERAARRHRVALRRLHGLDGPLRAHRRERSRRGLPGAKAPREEPRLRHVL